MVIIDKVKDYYDYMVGVYGRDEHVVFDRRDSEILVSLELGGAFNPNKIWSDKPKHKKPTGWNRYTMTFIKSDELVGEIHHVLIEIGFMHYIFEVERYLDEDGKLHLDTELLETKRVSKKLDNIPITYRYVRRNWNNTYTPIDNITRDCNIIMRDTWIPRYITPDEVWNNVYEYLLSIKDKKIVDSRTDVQKAESHGFNKESFRNPITLRELEKTNKNKKI